MTFFTDPIGTGTDNMVRCGAKDLRVLVSIWLGENGNGVDQNVRNRETGGKIVLSNTITRSVEIVKEAIRILLVSGCSLAGATFFRKRNEKSP